MSTLNGLREWATDRPRLAAGIGGGIVVLVAALFLLLGGGDDVQPVVDAAPVVPPAQSAPATTVATTEAEAPSEPQGVAPLQSGTGSAAGGDATYKAAPASRVDKAAAHSNEATMNAGLSQPRGLGPLTGTAPVSTPLVTDEKVKFIGQKLELVADAATNCMASGKQDIFDCLGDYPDEGFTIVRIYEDKPQGARIVVKGAEHVALLFRGGTRCRLLGKSEDCNGWSIYG